MTRLLPILAAAAAALAIAGCGDDDDSSDSGSAGSPYGGGAATTTEETTTDSTAADAPAARGTTIKLADSQFGQVLFERSPIFGQIGVQVGHSECGSRR